LFTNTIMPERSLPGVAFCANAAFGIYDPLGIQLDSAIRKARKTSNAPISTTLERLERILTPRPKTFTVRIECEMRR
jgi:hypothetical protein